MREKYDFYMNNYDQVEKILEAGAAHAREIARETIKRVRKAVGAK